MVLINSNFDTNVQIVQTDPQGRWMILNMLLDNKHIWLINLYGPNNDDPSIFENIYKNLSTLQATLDSIIMVGVPLWTGKEITLQTITLRHLRKS